MKGMSNQLLLNTIQMSTTEEMSSKLNTRNSPSTLQRTTKGSSYMINRCWTLLMLHEVCLPGLGDFHLQLDEGPVLQGDGHQADDVDLLAGPAALLCITYLQVQPSLPGQVPGPADP